MSKLLSQMVDQYVKKHGKAPQKIVVAPVAALTLAVKGSLSPVWKSIPVEMMLFNESEVVEPGKGTRLGVFLKRDADQRLRLAACDLR